MAQEVSSCTVGHKLSVHVELVATKNIWDRSFSQYCSFPVSASFHQCSLLLFSFTLLLPEGRNETG